MNIVCHKRLQEYITTQKREFEKVESYYKYINDKY